MTRERDRIQENANRYIVKNCPAFGDMASECYITEIKPCYECPDCVIKQVIELCREYDKEQAEWCEPIPFCTDNIYDLFDIEEINK